MRNKRLYCNKRTSISVRSKMSFDMGDNKNIAFKKPSPELWTLLTKWETPILTNSRRITILFSHIFTSNGSPFFTGPDSLSIP